MIIDLLGIVPDGSTLDRSRVPDNPRQRVRLVQGSTLVFRLKVLSPAGVPVDLSTDPAVTLYLTVKKDPTCAAIALVAAGSLDPLVAKNYATFTLTPSATKGLSPGLYAYDVWLTYNGVRDAIIPASSLHVEPGLRLP